MRQGPAAGRSAGAAFVALTRPVFLGGGALFYGLGAAAVHAAGGAISWPRYLLGQALVTAVQLATQYANELYDLDADRANPNRTWLSGGSGVLADGRLPPRAAERAALASAAAALVLAAAWVFVAAEVAALGVIALLGGWYYSAPPARLSASGWGELAASLIVAGLAPLTGALAQAVSVPRELWWIAAALVPAHVAMLLVLHLPDREADAATGKRTLVVRLGERAARSAVPALYALSAVAFVAADLPGRVVAGGLAGGAPAVAVAAFVAAGSTRWTPLVTGAVGALSGSAAGVTLALLV